MTYRAIHLERKFDLSEERWQPKAVVGMNECQFQLSKLEGDFLWHNHPETDETFLAVEGRLGIDFRDGSVDLDPGQVFAVPKRVEHKPFAERAVKPMIVDPRGVLNTGRAGGEFTAKPDVWI